MIDTPFSVKNKLIGINLFFLYTRRVLANHNKRYKRKLLYKSNLGNFTLEIIYRYTITFSTKIIFIFSARNLYFYEKFNMHHQFITIYYSFFRKLFLDCYKRCAKNLGKNEKFQFFTQILQRQLFFNFLTMFEKFIFLQIWNYENLRSFVTTFDSIKS